MRMTTVRLSDDYRSPIHAALIQQVVCSLFCLLLLDGGRTARVCGVSVVGFWVAAAIVMTRRPTSPTEGDLAWVRWGSLPLFVVTLLMTSLVGR